MLSERQEDYGLRHSWNNAPSVWKENYQQLVNTGTSSALPHQHPSNPPITSHLLPRCPPLSLSTTQVRKELKRTKVRKAGCPDRFWLPTSSRFYTTDFTYNSTSCPLQKVFDASAFDGLLAWWGNHGIQGAFTGVSGLVPVEPIPDNANTGEIRELVMDFCREKKLIPSTLVTL